MRYLADGVFAFLVIVAVLACVVVIGAKFGLDVWEYVHDKLRSEQKEDKEQNDK